MGTACSKGLEEQSIPTSNITHANSQTIAPEKSATYKLKIVLLGDIGVGKTALLHQLVNKKFNNKPTPDFDEVTKELPIGDKVVLLKMQDTKGQEGPGGRGLEAAFFEDAKGCVLVYDVTNPRSFDSLKNWHNQIITRVRSSQPDGKSFPFVVLGNKYDLDSGRNSNEFFERVNQWCQSNGNIKHILTSAKDKEKVDEAFQYIAKISLGKEMRSTIHDSPMMAAPKSSLSERSVKLDGEKLKPPPVYKEDNNEGSFRGQEGLVPQHPVPVYKEMLTSYNEEPLPKKAEGLTSQASSFKRKALEIHH